MKYDGITKCESTLVKNEQNEVLKKKEYRLFKVLCSQFFCAIVLLGIVLGLPKILPSTKGFSDILVEAVSYNIEELGTNNEDVGKSVLDEDLGILFGQINEA